MSADFVLVGSSPNALAAATRLAKGGARVVVLETRERVGGPVATEPFAPGFSADAGVASVALDPDVARALSLLKAWDSNESTDSAAAAIYEVWAIKHLGRATVAAAAPEGAKALLGASSPDPILTWLEAAPAKVRDPILLSSLTDAVAELKTTLGPNMADWRWGRLHHARFVPAIARLADPDLAAQMSLGPLSVPGSSSTPQAASYDAKTFDQTAGASVRLVLDVGAWDNSMAINTPGQSADPASPHYRDLFPLWAAGSYVPLRFSRAAVEGDAEAVMSLKPAP